MEDPATTAATGALGTVVLDADGRVVTVDGGAGRLLRAGGVEPAGLTGSSWDVVEESARGWLTVRREKCRTATGALVLVHLAPTRSREPAEDGSDQTWLAAALDCLDTGVMALDAQLQPVLINAALCRLHGHDPVAGGSWPGRPVLLAPDGGPVPDDQRLIARTLAEGVVRGARLAVRNEVTGDLRQVSVNAGVVLDVDGVTIGVVMAVHDVTETVVAQTALEEQADHDELTGLLNRRGFAKRVRALGSRGFGGGTTVIVCDVDRFKHVNDTYGHDIGDDLLVTVARALTGSAGPDAVVARLGGDEFAVVDPQDPGRFVDGVRAELGKGLPGLPVRLEMTFGLAALTDVGPDRSAAGVVADLVRTADQDMYAKRRARRGTSGLPVPA